MKNRWVKKRFFIFQYTCMAGNDSAKTSGYHFCFWIWRLRRSSKKSKIVHGRELETVLYHVLGYAFLN